MKNIVFYEVTGEKQKRWLVSHSLYSKQVFY